LTVSKIIKIVAISCQISRIKCTKFCWGSALDLQHSPDPLAGFKGVYFQREGREGGREEREGKWREGR